MGELIKLDTPNLKALPCPFCGNTEIVGERYETVVGDRYRIFCCGCMAGVDPGWAQNIHRVLDLWNRRA